MAKLEELVKNEEFITKLEQCENDDEVKSLYDEFNAEISDEEEFDEESLKSVVGGSSDIDISEDTIKAIMKLVKGAWKCTTSYAVIMIAYADACAGNVERHYSEKQIRKAAKSLGVEWLLDR